MINLSSTEAEIYRALSRIGRAANTTEIVEAVKIKHRKAMGSIQRLFAKGALERVGKGSYIAKHVTFSIGSSNPVSRDPIHIDTNVPEHIRKIIITEAKKKPQPKRLQIASKAGVSKLILNQILIEEGLDLEAK